MDTNKIIELLDAFSRSTATTLTLRDGSFKLKLDKNMQSQPVISTSDSTLPADFPAIQFAPPIIQPLSAPVIAPVEVSITNTPVQTMDDTNLQLIKSPIVGTFYASGGPELPPFVKIGDTVKKGQTLCIIEAMKLMNEIESDYDGEVVEICIENEDIVEYGQVLFKIK